jgi:hypothetical protein
MNEKKEQPKPLPPSERTWILPRKDLVITALRFVDDKNVAVSRAYCSDGDRYSKKKGANIARARMQNFYPIFKDKGLTAYRSNDQRQTRKRREFLLFAVMSPEFLQEEEKVFFDNVLLPNVKKQLENK